MHDDATRRVSAFTAASVLVSSVIGSGIFTTTGFMARDLGDPRLILVLWALGGALALAGAMSYGELGAALPRVGGEYVYLRRAFGPLLGFLSGWTSFTIGFSAAIALGSASTAFFLVELLPEGFPLRNATTLALIVLWALTAVHVRGVESGGRVQNLLTLLKVAGIGLLIAGALIFGQGSWENLTLIETATQPRLGLTFIALVFVLFTYSGWNTAAYIAGEIRDPGRNLPRVMIGGTLFVTVIYLMVNVVYFYALPASLLAQEPIEPVAQKAAAALLGPIASTAVVTVLCVSIAGATSAMIWAGPRVYFAMAQDGVFPTAFARASSAGTPVRSILLQSVWVTLLLFSGTFEQLLVYSGVALALFSALAVAAVPVLRIREPELPRPYRVPLYPWLPLAYVAASLLTAGYAATERPFESLMAAVTLLAGIPCYCYWTRARRRYEASDG
jgi:APA family basic amino acid/polyamine antiporter